MRGYTAQKINILVDEKIGLKRHLIHWGDSKIVYCFGDENKIKIKEHLKINAAKLSKLKLQMAENQECYYTNKVHVYIPPHKKIPLSLNQKNELAERSKQMAVYFYIATALFTIFRERCKREKKLADEIRDWSIGKTRGWPLNRQIDYILKYKHLIPNYKNVDQWRFRYLESLRQSVCRYEIQKGMVILGKSKIRFRMKLTLRKWVPDGEYFLYRRGPGYRKNAHYLVFTTGEEPESFDSGPHTSGFLSYEGGAGVKHYYNRIGRAVVYRNMVVWFEERKKWEDNFDWN